MTSVLACGLLVVLGLNGCAHLVQSRTFLQTSHVSTKPSIACEMNATQKCAFNDLSFPSSANASAIVFPGGSTRCAFDDPALDGLPAPLVKKKYFFQVVPARSRSKDNVLLYFQGGGACIDNSTCSYFTYCAFPSSPLFTPFVTLYNHSGILNRTRAQDTADSLPNPLDDWNFIGISYCTGDAHLGNVVRNLSPPKLLGLVSPKCAKKQPIHQVGFRNAMAVLDWARENFPNPKKLVVGGVSAGSLAAQLYAKVVASKWQIINETGSTSTSTSNNNNSAIEYSVLADSYMGVLPNKQDAGRLLLYFGACDNELGFSDDLKTKCQSGTLTVADIVQFNLQAVPSAKWLFINSEGDRVQRLYYQLVKDGLMGFPFLQLITPETFYQDMLELVNSYKQVSPLVSATFIAGEHHGFLVSPLFYSTQDVTGARLPALLSDWLQHDEHAVQNHTKRMLVSCQAAESAREMAVDHAQPQASTSLHA